MKQKLQFAKFLIAGGVSVPFNLGSRVLFSLVMPFEVAVVFSQCIGMLVAYLLMRAFVFESTRASYGAELYRFAMVNVVSGLQTLIVASGLLRLLFPLVGYAFEPELTAHAVGLGSAALTAFFGHRKFSFREKRTV